MADNTAGTSPFMSLPAEIREMIWKGSVSPRVMSTGYARAPERSSADTYHRRVESHAAYAVFRRRMGKRRRGNWILAEWGRTPVTMGQDDLVRLDWPVSEVYARGAHEHEDDDGKGAVLAVERCSGLYPADTEHPGVKACLARMPEMRFVLSM